MEEIPGRIEHTALGPTTAWEDVAAVLDDCREYGMRACLPPSYLDEARSYAPDIEVSTVVGFPHGQHTVETKCAEATDAWQTGAAELDLVPNLGRARTDADALRDEIDEVVAAVPIPVKVILETSLFTDSELRRLAQTAVDASAAFLKTATGYAGGATVEDVRLLAEYGPVKASGGVGSWAFAEELFAAGAERIGASSGDVIVAEYLDQQ